MYFKILLNESILKMFFLKRRLFRFFDLIDSFNFDFLKRRFMLLNGNKMNFGDDVDVGEK